MVFAFFMILSHGEYRIVLRNIKYGWEHMCVSNRFDTSSTQLV